MFAVPAVSELTPWIVAVVIGSAFLGLWFAWGVYTRLERWWRFNKYRYQNEGVRFVATRRNALKLGAGLVVGGAAIRYWPAVSSELPSAEAVANGSVVSAGTPATPDPYVQTFNGAVVERIEFDKDGSMAVTMADSHGADGFGVWHASDDEQAQDPVANYGLGIGTSELPRYGGSVTINITKQLANSAGSYPSNEFVLIAIRGFVQWEPVGRVRFSVPEALMP